jgi:hypothetical protein
LPVRGCDDGVVDDAEQVLRRGRGQRRRHVAGDWFGLQFAQDGTFRVGVIVRTGDHTPAARFPGGILAYLYDPSFAALPGDAPDLDADRLLMPPFFTHPQMWRLGYFRTFAHRPLQPRQLVPQHCFLDVDFRGDLYVDDHDEVLDRRYEPCGFFALPSAAGLAGFVGDAVRGALAPVKQAEPRR